MRPGFSRADSRIPPSASSILLFLLGFLPPVVASACYLRATPSLGVGTIYQAHLPPPGPDQYLAVDPDLIDYDVYLHNFYGVVDSARQAEVLFVGNSRALYAFRTSAVKPHFDRLGIRYYNLSFAGGADLFPRTLIREFDLHPKILVVNVQQFFIDDLSQFGAAAVQRDRFQAWNFVWERQWSWRFRYDLHQLLPHWPTLLFLRRDQQVIYRAAGDGSWQWAMPIVEPRPLGDAPPPPPAPGTADERALEVLTARQRSVLPGFVEEMRARGTEVVLVYVPYFDGVIYHAAVDAARAAGVPLLAPWPAGLTGAVGTHMGEDSAVRYVDALMPELLKTPPFQRLLAAQEAAR